MDFKKWKKQRKDMNKAVSKMKDQKPSYIDDRFWKPTPDKQENVDAVIRFLPKSDVGEDEFYVMRFGHFIRMNGKFFVVDCCPVTFGDPCPADEYAQPYWDKANEYPKDSDEYKRYVNIAGKYSKSKEFIANILVVNDLACPENNGKVFLYKFGPKIYDKILDKIAPDSELDEAVMVYDLLKGCNFKLKRRKGQGGWHNYDSSEFYGEKTPVAKTEKEIIAICEQIKPLDEFIDPKIVKSYSDLKKKFIEMVGEDAAKFFHGSKSNESTGTEVNMNQDTPDNTDDTQFDDKYDNMSDDSDKQPEVSGDIEVEDNDESDDDFDFDFDENDFNFDDE